MVRYLVICLSAAAGFSLCLSCQKEATKPSTSKKPAYDASYSGDPDSREQLSGIGKVQEKDLDEDGTDEATVNDEGTGNGGAANSGGGTLPSGTGTSGEGYSPGKTGKPTIQNVDKPCTGITCGDNGQCIEHGTSASYNELYGGDGSQAEHSGSGRHNREKPFAVCACNKGFTALRDNPLTCVPTTTVCKGGEIDYDVDGDGIKETFFEPSASECRMYELINYTRATHVDQGRPECHIPLNFSVEWSAHGRNHSKKQAEQGKLFHDDVPGGQNCASNTTPEVQIDMYMNGPNEPHCSELSHHCNIMRCRFTTVGVGNYPFEGDSGYNTQNFY